MFCLSLLLSNSTYASLADDLDKLIAALPPGHTHSIKVVDAKTGKVVFRRNSSANLIPASTTKVLTAISAYKILGKDFRYATTLLGSHPVAADYSGDLVLSFSGDPSLTRKNLTGLLQHLANKELRSIRGNLWLDGTLYDGYPRASGTSWDDHNICFAAPVDAMILDGNCFYGWLKPASKEGDLAVMIYDAPQWPLSVENRIATRKPLPYELGGCVQEVWPSSSHEYRLEGCVEPGSKPVRMAFAVRDPLRAVVRHVNAFLKANNIRLEGKVVVGRPLDDSFFQVLAVHYSRPVSELLQHVLEKSDNLYADSLLKTIGLSFYKQKGSYFSGTRAVLTMFQKEDVGLSRSRLMDGSGLSRFNLLSADDFIAVLQAGWRYWEATAPWLVTRKDERHWLKTGYMSGVNNMVGYVFEDKQPTLVFAVLINGLRPRQSATMEEFQAFNRDIRRFHRAFLDRLTTAD